MEVFGAMCCCFLVPLAATIPMFVGMWLTFEKAGEPGWSAIVPIYNAMVMARIVGREETFGLLTMIPVAGIYFAFVLIMELCEEFDQGAGFAVGLLLLPYVFWPILGFGSSRFRGGRGGRSRSRSSSRRPRRARRRDDEEDRPRRRRRPREDDYEDDDY